MLTPEAVVPRRHSGWTLAIYHIGDMVSHMKTTLNIDDTVMAELKREAARQGRTMSELVEAALRLLLRSQRKRAKSRPADVSQWRHTCEYCRPRRPLPGYGRSLVLVVDTNVLLYVAVDVRAYPHRQC
jgi:Arc/MetJ family transcription regulator